MSAVSTTYFFTCIACGFSFCSRFKPAVDRVGDAHRCPPEIAALALAPSDEQPER